MVDLVLILLNNVATLPLHSAVELIFLGVRTVVFVVVFFVVTFYGGITEELLT